MVDLFFLKSCNVYKKYIAVSGETALTKGVVDAIHIHTHSHTHTCELYVCYGLNVYVPTPNPYIKTPIPGDRASKEVMKVNEIMRWGPDPTELVPL